MDILLTLLGVMGGAIVAGGGGYLAAYIAFHNRIRDLELQIEMLDGGERDIPKIAKRIIELRAEISKADENYREISPILDRLMDKRRHFEDAEKLLETISKYPEGMNILDELKSIKQQLEDNHYSKYSDLIQIGRYEINKYRFPQLEDPSKNGIGKYNYRKADPWIEFNSEFNSTPKVFVAFAMIDSANSENTRIQVSVDVPSISKSGFKAILETWDKSRVHKVEIVWIAFGQ